MSVLFYGVAGPELAFKAGAELSAASPACYTVSAPYSLIARIKIPALHLSSPDLTIWNTTRTLAQVPTPPATCGQNPAPPGPPPPGPPPPGPLPGESRPRPPASQRFTQLTAGTNYTCGLRTEGTAVCWGEDRYGQSTPPGGTLTGLTTGDTHACGLRANGTAVCWGSNFVGEATVPGGTFTQLSAGGPHTCALRQDGTAACWGHNDSGQATVPGGSVTQLAAGSTHTCGLRTDGTAACWGNDTSGSRRRRAGRSPPSPRVALIRAGCAPTRPPPAGGMTSPASRRRRPGRSLSSPRPAAATRAGYAPTGPPPAGAMSSTGKRRRRADFHPTHGGPISYLRLAHRRDRRVLGIRTSRRRLGASFRKFTQLTSSSQTGAFAGPPRPRSTLTCARGHAAHHVSTRSSLTRVCPGPPSVRSSEAH